MIDLSSFSLSDILPPSLMQNSENKAMAEALTVMLKKVFEESSILDPTLPFPEKLLDIIAKEEHVDFYDMNMSVVEKRALIEKASIVHQIKGTPAAIEEVAAIFFNKPRLVEWFEYGGSPYFFKIETEEDFKSEADIVKIFRLVEAVKRKSTRLEGIWFKKKNGVYFSVVKTDKIRIKPVMKFFSGLAMPGNAINATVSVTSKYNTGMSTPNFSGECFPGNKKNSVTTGFSLNGKLKINPLLQIGEGIFETVQAPTGSGQSANQTQKPGIGLTMSSGSSTMRFCGKMFAGKEDSDA